MPRCLLIRGAKQLVTLHGAENPRRGLAMREIGLIADGSVLVRDGMIEEVGPTRRVENLALARQAELIDATGRVVMPGFVDSHTHLVHGAPWLAAFEQRIAGTMPDAGLGFHAAARAIRTVSARRLELRAGGILATMVKHGTTTLEARTGFGADQSGETKILRVLAHLAGKPLDIVPTVMLAPPGTPEPDLGRAAAQWLAKIARRRLAVFAGTFLLEGRYEETALAAGLKAARELGFRVKVSGRPALAVAAGATATDLAGEITAEEVRLIANAPTIATVLPGPAFHMRCERYPPARALVDAGAAVALATGFNPQTSPTCNMQMTLALACTYMAMTPAEAISAATINGACACGLGSRAGSLQPGKLADLLVLNVSDYRELPYWFGVNLVHTTMKRGVVIYSECPVG